jgi:hypothetical protein
MPLRNFTLTLANCTGYKSGLSSALVASIEFTRLRCNGCRDLNNLDLWLRFLLDDRLWCLDFHFHCRNTNNWYIHLLGLLLERLFHFMLNH